MSTIPVKTLKDALSKARNVGLVEEAFSLEGCDFVIRNLRPAEYAAVMQDCAELEELAYLNHYQMSHLARAIVEIDGVDLRGVTIVQVDERTKMELHQYLLDNVISTWSKEFLYTAFRKFGDVVELAERKAREGVTFILPDETDSEKYRRLLTEAKSVEGELPDTLVKAILDEVGFASKSSQQELQSVEQSGLAEFAKEQMAELAEAEVETPAEEEPEPAPEPEAPKRVIRDPHATLQAAIAKRQQPQQAGPAPVVEPPPASQLPAAEVSTRAALIAALEREEETLEIDARAPAKPDPKHVRVDGPPSAGINPRYRAPR